MSNVSRCVKKIPTLLIAAAITAGLLFSSAAPASAWWYEGQAKDGDGHYYYPRVILKQCDSGAVACKGEDIRKIDSKTFKPIRTSKRYQNCTANDQTIVLRSAYTKSITISNTYSTGFRIGIENSSGVDSSYIKTTFELNFQYTRNKSWTSTETRSEEFRITVSPGRTVWTETAVQKDVVSGTFVATYPEPVNGHKVWTLKNQTFTVPPIDGSTSDVSTIRDEPVDCNSGDPSGEVEPNPKVVI